ncbi:MAG: glycosyltransferase family 4 protein [Actinobacteria bacterium]|nr:glycosyltransferase family 4 protein [Actinomycetota bacterium]
MIRVVHLSVVHTPDDPRIYGRECRTLADAGYDVTYIAPGAPAGRDEHGIQRRPLPRRGRSSRWLSVREIVAELRRLRPHVLHVHDPELLTLFPVAHALAPRLVYDMHEYLPEQVAIKPYIPSSVRPAAARLTAVAQRDLARFGDGVISAAPLQLRALGAKPALRAALLNYPRFSRFTTLAARPELLADARFKLVHVGGLSEGRGLFLMLDVMAALGPDLPVVLYLAGRHADPADAAAVRARVEAELPGRVVLLGELPPKDVPGYLSAADVAWSPILRGPQFELPNVLTKIYEGMAAGCATLVSDFSDHGDPIRRERCGLAVPPTVEGHVDGVRRLLADPHECARMGERGRRAVRERYSWEAIEGHLVDFYAELCKGL